MTKKIGIFSLPTLAITIGILNLLDLITTCYGLTHGAIETNWFVKSLITSLAIIPFVIIKSSVSIMFFYAAAYDRFTKNEKFRKFLAITYLILILLYIWALINNWVIVRAL